MLYQHSAVDPIGLWEEIREDARGLYVRGRLIADVARGREAMALIREGALDGLSIGFRTVRASRDAATQLRILNEIDLWEISLVTFPQQAESLVIGVGAKGDTLAAHIRNVSKRMASGE